MPAPVLETTMPRHRKTGPWRQCDRCKSKFPRNGNRYCGPCYAVVRREMNASGYLTHIPSRMTRGHEGVGSEV